MDKKERDMKEGGSTGKEERWKERKEGNKGTGRMEGGRERKGENSVV